MIGKSNRVVFHRWLLNAQRSKAETETVDGQVLSSERVLSSQKTASLIN